MALPQTLARAPIIKKLRAGGKLRSRKNKAWRADILSTSLCGMFTFGVVKTNRC